TSSPTYKSLKEVLATIPSILLSEAEARPLMAAPATIPRSFCRMWTNTQLRRRAALQASTALMAQRLLEGSSIWLLLTERETFQHLGLSWPARASPERLA